MQLLGENLLGAHPVRRASNLAQRLAVVVGKGAEPKVGDPRTQRVVQQHVGALEVAVHNVVCVQVRHPGCHLCHNPQRRHQVQRVVVHVQVVVKRPVVCPAQHKRQRFFRRVVGNAVEVHKVWVSHLDQHKRLAVQANRAIRQWGSG